MASSGAALELREADRALERLEEWLLDQGFFTGGSESFVADLHLGCGLSETIGRTRIHPDPFVGEGWAVVSASPEVVLRGADGGYGRCR